MHLGLNSSLMVLPEAVDYAFLASEPSPEPGTYTAMADPDQPSKRSVPNVDPAPAADMTPLSNLISEVKVHTPSDVTAETSALARVEMAISKEAVSLTTSATQTLINMCPEDVVLLLPHGGWWLSEASMGVLAVLR